MIKSGSGLVIIAWREDGSNIVPGKEIAKLWVLKRSVKLRPRLGFFRTWKRQTAMRKRVLAEHLTKAVDSIGRDANKGT